MFVFAEIEQLQVLGLAVIDGGVCGRLGPADDAAVGWVVAEDVHGHVHQLAAEAATMAWELRTVPDDASQLLGRAPAIWGALVDRLDAPGGVHALVFVLIGDAVTGAPALALGFVRACLGHGRPVDFVPGGFGHGLFARFETTGLKRLGQLGGEDSNGVWLADDGLWVPVHHVLRHLALVSPPAILAPRHHVHRHHRHFR